MDWNNTEQEGQEGGISTWRKELLKEMTEHGDSLDNLEFCTLTEDELDVEFDADCYSEEGKSFILWTTERVYFPVTYDGSEWVGSVPRNPIKKLSSEYIHHFGG